MAKHEVRTSLLSGASSSELPAWSRSTSHDPHSMESSFAYGGYAQREGLQQPVLSKDASKASWWYLPDSKWTWSFAGLVVFQAIVALALEGYFFATFQKELTPEAKGQPFSEVVPTYLSLFIFGFLYEIMLTYDALRLRNTIQIIGLCLYNLGLTIEAAVQYDQTHDAIALAGQPASVQGRDNQSDTSRFIKPTFLSDVKPIIIAVPIFLGVVTVAMSLIAWKLSDEFAWSIYKNISADLRLKKRFLSYQIYIALLKFDFFFFLAFTVQFLVILPRTGHTEGGGSNAVEFYVTVAAIPVTIFVLILAALFARRENIAGMVGVIIIYFGALAYFAYKLIRMYHAPGPIEAIYAPAKHSLTTFAVITLVLVCVTIVYAIIVTINFGKGLKPHVRSTRQRRRAGSSDMDKLFNANDVQLGPGGGPGPARMEID